MPMARRLRIALVMLALTCFGQPASAADRLPTQVDLRPRLAAYDLPPRAQGARNTCSVFVATGALEFALSRRLGQGVTLSVEYLNWAANQVVGNRTKDRGQFFHHLLQGFERHGIVTEAEMPYRPQFDPAYTPSAALRSRARQVAERGLVVHWINPWRKEPGLTEAQLGEIKSVLARGWPVAAGATHSRLLVGYADDPRQPGGGSFLTKDSGKAAFARITYEFARTRLGDVFWVEAPGAPQ